MTIGSLPFSKGGIQAACTRVGFRIDIVLRARISAGDIPKSAKSAVETVLDVVGAFESGGRLADTRMRSRGSSTRGDVCVSSSDSPESIEAFKSASELDAEDEEDDAESWSLSFRAFLAPR